MTDPAYPAPVSAQTVAAQAKYNVLSIVAIIGGFIIPIVGIITGFIALRQISVTHERGRGLALTGIIVGFAIIVLSILIGIVGAIAGAASVSSY